MEIFNIRSILIIIIVIVGFNYYTAKQESDMQNLSLPLETKILAFGDSLTKGYGVPAVESYPSILSELLRTSVVNEGIAGELSEQGVERLEALLDKHKPQILVLCHGANDILRKKDLFKTKDNLLKMVQMAKSKGVYVLLVGVPTYEILSFKTASFYYDVAKAESVEIEDSALEKILGDDALKSDHVHPNALGYQLMAKKIAKLLSDNYHPVASF